MIEAAVERFLVEEARRRGGLAVKHVSPGRAGDPDRLVALPMERCACCGSAARVGLLELKRPGGAARSLQEARIGEWVGLGVLAGVADTPAAVLARLDGWRRGSVQ